MSDSISMPQQNVYSEVLFNVDLIYLSEGRFPVLKTTSRHTKHRKYNIENIKY